MRQVDDVGFRDMRYYPMMETQMAHEIGAAKGLGPLGA